ncbi:MAG: SoxR reducing system RseC family protein [Pseudomonadales bacterium]|nr:SoxR reducing system RseC family protein [Halioglobus sp.]MCP5129515.1 SoxR reducing system RseC family protein [Pseudomonadales bacterium]
MLIETGRVVALEDGALWVETIRQSTCGSCAANKGCGHGLLNRIADGRTGYVRVLSGAVAAEQCAVDDQVRIGIPEQVILRGSMLIYMLPLVCMLAAASALQVLWPATGPGAPEWAAIGGAVIGLAIGFSLVYWHAWRHSNDRDLQPTLLAVLPRATLPVRLA